MNDSPDELGPQGLGSDELALRRLLHEAVQDVEPRDGTLDHLRRAVPARRARKRQAAVGMAAAALFLGTAVPALVHVSNSTGSADPSPVGHGAAAQGGAGEGKGEDGGQGEGGGTDGGAGKGGTDGGRPADPDKGGSGGSGSGGGGGSSDTGGSGAPECTADQLSATGSLGAPDSMGAVYGTFRVTNNGDGSCTVSGPGTVTPLAQGAADPGRIGVASHVAGDAAGGLPDPSLEAGRLVLLPGAAYEVRFGWVPSEACPTGNGSGGGDGGSGDGGTDGGSGDGGTDGGSGDGGTDGGSTDGGTTPTPTPTPTDATTTSSGSGGTTTDGAAATSGDTGMSTQLVTQDWTSSGSVIVAYAAEPGAPGASVTIGDACAGTVYRTGLLSGS
ncbi:hypothetical protein [Streptomyces sp. enrichment culture]|uniref:hypothetical protein n=1 Tax=Streptomyces sp. enrichment culture TaxID=1795815 RepID=UPI003F570502